jgi:hypothetical protein
MAGRKTPRDMGLGSRNDVSLAVGRLDATAKCGQIQQGVDPIEARKRDKIVAALELTKAITFKDCTEAYIAAHREEWRNEMHAAHGPLAWKPTHARSWASCRWGMLTWAICSRFLSRSAMT